MIPGRLLGLAIALSCAAAPRWSRADDAGPTLPSAGIVARPGARLPLDLPLIDEAGRAASLRALLDGKAGLVAPVDLDCRQLCGTTLADLFQALAELPADAHDFDTVVLSIDERETPADAAVVRRDQLDSYGKGWPADHVRIALSRRGAARQIAQAGGYSYQFDAATDQFAHPAAVAVVRGDGMLGRWLFGYPFEAKDIRLALGESALAPPGIAQRSWLLCYRYNPVTGRYGLAVDRIVMAACLLTALGLALGIGAMLRRERRAGR